jgi:hypothetical protein
MEEVEHKNLADTEVPVFRAKFDYMRKDRRNRVYIMESTAAATVSHKSGAVCNTEETPLISHSMKSEAVCNTEKTPLISHKYMV